MGPDLHRVADKVFVWLFLWHHGSVSQSRWKIFHLFYSFFHNTKPWLCAFMSARKEALKDVKHQVIGSRLSCGRCLRWRRWSCRPSLTSYDFVRAQANRIRWVRDRLTLSINDNPIWEWEIRIWETAIHSFRHVRIQTISILSVWWERGSWCIKDHMNIQTYIYKEGGQTDVHKEFPVEQRYYHRFGRNDGWGEKILQ